MESVHDDRNEDRAKRGAVKHSRDYLKKQNGSNKYMKDMQRQSRAGWKRVSGSQSVRGKEKGKRGGRGVEKR